MTVNHDVAGSSPAGGAINGTSYLVPFFFVLKYFVIRYFN